MRSRAAFAGFTFVLLLTLAHAQNAPVTTSAEFARVASEHFTTQIEAARLAQAKSKDPSVKDFASQIAVGYEEAGRRLVKLCEELNIDLAPQPRTGQATAGAVSTAPDSAFDNVYTLELSQALAKAETSFEAAMQSPKVDPKLKDFARQQKEAIQQYRKRADPLSRRQAGQGKG
jgi:putative membrane protein